MAALPPFGLTGIPTNLVQVTVGDKWTFDVPLRGTRRIETLDRTSVPGQIDPTVGLSYPLLIQGAQHVFHPPMTLEGAHDTDPRSRIVFIVRNIPRESIEALFAAVGALGS